MALTGMKRGPERHTMKPAPVKRARPAPDRGAAGRGPAGSRPAADLVRGQVAEAHRPRRPVYALGLAGLAEADPEERPGRYVRRPDKEFGAVGGRQAGAVLGLHNVVAHLVVAASPLAASGRPGQGGGHDDPRAGCPERGLPGP